MLHVSVEGHIRLHLQAFAQLGLVSVWSRQSLQAIGEKEIKAPDTAFVDISAPNKGMLLALLAHPHHDEQDGTSKCIVYCDVVALTCTTCRPVIYVPNPLADFKHRCDSNLQGLTWIKQL